MINRLALRMTEEDRKRLKEKLFVISHQFGHLKPWEIALINDVENEIRDSEKFGSPTKLELEVIERLYKGEL